MDTYYNKGTGKEHEAIHLAGNAEHKASPQPEQWPVYEGLGHKMVEAIQWTGANLDEVKAFVRGRYCVEFIPEPTPGNEYNLRILFDVDPKFGSIMVPVGDWIYWYPPGERIGTMPDWIFAKMFTAVYKSVMPQIDKYYYTGSDTIFTKNYIQLPKEEPMPARPQTQDPFEPMRQVIDLDSYEYLNEAYPFYIQAIEHALTAGKTPTDIGKFVIENTSSRRDIGLLCEQAARHIQRKGQAV